MNDLPSYPTPKQAAYVVNPNSNPSNGRRKPSSHANVNYKPPSSNQYSSRQNYGQPMQSSNHSMHSNPQPVGQVHFQQGPPPPQQSSNYYQQSQPPPPQQQNYYQPPPQQQQPNNYYQPPPPQPQQPPQQHYQQAPIPQKRSPSHGYQNMAPVQPQSSYHQQPPVQQRYEGHGVKMPSNDHPSNVPAVPTINKNRSKESLNDKQSTKQKLEYELRSVFDKVDANSSGKISKSELSNALLNFDHTKFSDSTVTLMINLFSNSSSTTKHLNFDQFVSLWKYLSAYKKLFVQADTNSSGDISFGEFQKILEQIGYKLNIDLVLHLFQKFCYKDHTTAEGPVGTLKFDKFIELLVYLRKLTDVFKKYDKDLSGVATINFSDFLLEISNLS
ncbi:peflin [[Candida] jaroonii]|uniref:Peflin n=1 Tax=[Candida] jaroonii TaxID=467808 RepID=A0ACA9Y0X5_9ASCO|nr:peflin [[Candida] jaroonii]